jgi:hypothetical protein
MLHAAYLITPATPPLCHMLLTLIKMLTSLLMVTCLHATALRYYATCYMLLPHATYVTRCQLHVTCFMLPYCHTLHVTCHITCYAIDTATSAIIALHANATCYMPHAAMLATCHAPHAATSLRHTPRHATPPRRYAATLATPLRHTLLHAAMPHAGYAATAKTRHATCATPWHATRQMLATPLPHAKMLATLPPPLHATCRPLAVTTLMLLTATWPLTPHALIAYITAPGQPPHRHYRHMPHADATPATATLPHATRRLRHTLPRHAINATPLRHMPLRRRPDATCHTPHAITATLHATCHTPHAD